MVMKISKIILISLLLIFTSSCVRNWWKPISYRVFNQMPEGGSPGFNLGWIHGCESGLGSNFGGAFFMSFYSWKKDVDIMSANPDIPKIRERYKDDLKDVNWDDPEEVKRNFSDYKQIFWSAHIFCRHTVLQTLQSANMEPPQAGDVRYDPMAHSLENIWCLHCKGDARIGSPAPGAGFW